MGGEIHLTYWVLHSNVLYCQVCASTIFLESKMALYNYIDILAFNAMGGREKGREGTLKKCGELYFSVGCTM